VLVMIRSMSVPICNRFHVKQSNSRERTTFREYRSLTPTCANLIERRRSGLGLLKSTFNGKNFICRLPWVCLQPFRRNSLLKCVSQPEIAKKITKSPYFVSSRSFKVIDVDITKKLVGRACYDKQHVSICNHFHARVLEEPIVAK